MHIFSVDDFISWPFYTTDFFFQVSSFTVTYNAGTGDPERDARAPSAKSTRQWCPKIHSKKMTGQPLMNILANLSHACLAVNTSCPTCGSARWGLGDDKRIFSQPQSMLLITVSTHQQRCQRVIAGALSYPRRQSTHRKHLQEDGFATNRRGALKRPANIPPFPRGAGIRDSCSCAAVRPSVS